MGVSAIDGVPATAPATTGRFATILRDVARNGIAGLLTGVLVAGIGGRIVMRVAAIVVPSASGQFTENGNRIGDITVGGSVALLLVGMFFGGFGAVVWTVISPWLPSGARSRAFLAAIISVALTGMTLIQGFNPDFRILQHDRLTVVLLVLLVGSAGLSISALDTWLDRRLPRAGASPTIDAVYLLLTVVGAVLILPVVLAAYLGEELAVGLALVVVGLATLVDWWTRYRDVPRPIWLRPTARAALVVAVLLGFVALLPDLARAAGL